MYAHIHTPIYMHPYTHTQLCVFSHLPLKTISGKWAENATFPGTKEVLVFTGVLLPVLGMLWVFFKKLSLCCDLTPCVCLTTRLCPFLADRTGQTRRRESHTVALLAKLWPEHKWQVWTSLQHCVQTQHAGVLTTFPLVSVVRVSVYFGWSGWYYIIYMN